MLKADYKCELRSTEKMMELRRYMPGAFIGTYCIHVQHKQNVGSEATLETEQSVRVSMSTSFQLEAIFEPIYGNRCYFESTGAGVHAGEGGMGYKYLNEFALWKGK